MPQPGLGWVYLCPFCRKRVRWWHWWIKGPQDLIDIPYGQRAHYQCWLKVVTDDATRRWLRG
jgi:hypothetical protein